MNEMTEEEIEQDRNTLRMLVDTVMDTFAKDKYPAYMSMNVLANCMTSIVINIKMSKECYLEFVEDVYDTIVKQVREAKKKELP